MHTILTKIAFESLPESYNDMKNAIKDENLKNIYSNFEFFYLDASKNQLNDDDKNMKKLLHDTLNEFNFYVYNFASHNESMSDLSKNSFYNDWLSDIVICAEKKCFIIEHINVNTIKYAINQFLMDKQIYTRFCIHELAQQVSDINLNDEINNFCSFFTKNGIFENRFVQYTLSSIACYLIRRFFYPTNFFKDQTFFFDKSNLQTKENEFIIKFNDLFNSKNIEQVREYNEELTFINDNHLDQQTYENFNENDFVQLKTFKENSDAKFILVIHIKNLQIFSMKKFKDSKLTKYQKKEIKFCQTYHHRCFVPFFGFVKNNQEITGLIYQYMVNDTLDTYFKNYKNENNQIFSYMTMIRLLEGLNYLQSKNLIHRDLKPANILLDNDNIPFISDIETYKDLDLNEAQTKDLGSNEFMSPEQYYSENISFATDIFSFGLIVYFLFEHEMVKFDYLRFKTRLDNYPDMTACPNNINYLYKSCVRMNQNERIKISDLYKIITNELLELKDINYINNLNAFHVKTSIISHYLYENIQMLMKFQTETQLREYLFKFYFFVLSKLTKNADYQQIGFNNLGNLYYLNFGTDKNLEKARILYEYSGKLHNPHALNSLGDFYRLELGVKQDFSKAIEYYKKAKKLGDSNALNSLGHLYYNGYGVKQNQYKAYKYFKKAAKENNSHAMCSIGFILEDGKVEKNNCKDPINYYNKAIDLKNYNGLVNIGLLFLKGDGVPQKYEIARQYFEEAAQKNIPNGIYNLGKMYLYGQSVEIDYNQAEIYLKKAKEYGHMDATYYLGYLYYLKAKKKLNQNIDENDKLYKKAMENFVLASQEGSPESFEKIAILYEKGLGVEQSYPKARQFYEHGCNIGHHPTCYKFAMHLSNGYIYPQNTPLAIQYLSQCIETNGEKMKIEKNGFYNIRYNKYCHPAENELGLIYLFDDTLSNIKLARKFIFAAAEYEYPIATNNYGLLVQFILYKDVFDSNVINIIKWYVKSIEYGFCLAYYNLGYFLEKYPGITKQYPEINTHFTLKSALEYYMDAVQHENEPIIYHTHKIKFKDHRMNTSISFIMCFAKLKLIYYFLSNDNLNFENAKKYFMNVYSNLKDNKYSDNLAEPIKEEITSIKSLIDHEITKFFEDIYESHKERIENEYELYLRRKLKNNNQQFIQKNVKKMEIIKDPNELFELISKNKNIWILFLQKIQKIIDLMNSYLYKPPYRILFGKIDLKKENKMYPLAKNIDKSFYRVSSNRCSITRLGHHYGNVKV